VTVETDAVFRDELVTYQSFQLIHERHVTHDSEYHSALEDTAATSEFGYITVRDTLTEILRAGAQKMLRAAIQKEVADYMNERTDITDKNGRRLVVRNGSLPEREMLTGVGPGL